MQDSFYGINDIPDEYTQIVKDTFEKGEVVETSKQELESTASPKVKREINESDRVATSRGKVPGMTKEQVSMEVDEGPPRPKGNTKKPSSIDGKGEAPEPKQVGTKKVDGDDGEEVPKPKRKSKKKVDDTGVNRPKRKSKKRAMEEMDEDSEPEYVPRKTRSRAVPMVEDV
jgi:hypothetical protein